VVGVDTLPALGRRGLGAAVTGLLVEDARRRGIETAFLTAGDDEVARLYGRLGFPRRDVLYRGRRLGSGG
jgi:GNAT superfamily N-acetyltransferase